MKQILRIADKCFVVLGLTTFPGILYALPKAGLLSQDVITFMKYGVWATLIILVCIFWKDTIITITQNILLFVLIALAILSFLWSEFPDYTLQTSIELFMMALFSIYFAQRFSLKEQVELVACTLLIAAVLSAIFAIAFPAVGISGVEDGYPGTWKGVYGQKNALGNMMVLSSITFFALPKENSTIYRWFGFSFSMIMMLFSSSKTSLVSSFLLISTMVFYKKFKWLGKISVIFTNIGILILGCVALVVFSYWIELLTGLGRDPTLTGRTPIWSYALRRLMERPLLGYGVSAFWAPNSKYAVEAGQGIGSGWIVPNAHDGFLDLAISLGLIGFSLFLISYFTTFTRALKRAYGTENLEELWPLGYLTFVAMNNITESLLLGQFSLPWILYTTVVFVINKKKKYESKT